MRALFSDNHLSQELYRQAIKFAIVPIVFLVPVFAFDIEVESIYDFCLEVIRLYSVILIAAIAEILIHLRVVRIGLVLAVINCTYDALTEIVYFETILQKQFPFSDALMDEALLIAAYGCIIWGLMYYLRQINTASLTDNLTKCYTRSALDLIPHGKYQLFYLDLDNFKQINDTKGHEFGDKVLTIFARRLIRCCNDIGYIVRLGGDEFLAIIDIDDAYSFIDTFTKACDLEAIEFSYGTAFCEGDSFKTAISEADENLYEMKQYKQGSDPYIVT